MSYELCYCVYISVYPIPAEPGRLLQWHYDCVLLELQKYCKFSSRVAFLYNIFVVCVVGMGLIWILSYVVSVADIYGLEHVSVVSDYLLATTIVSINLSWLCEVGEVEFKGPWVTPGCCLFFPSFCERPIMLYMIGE